MFRPSRTGLPGGADPFLPWKVRAFVAGAGLALVGLATETSWLVGAAVVVLGAGLALRLFSGRQARRP